MSVEKHNAADMLQTSYYLKVYLLFVYDNWGADEVYRLLTGDPNCYCLLTQEENK